MDKDYGCAHCTGGIGIRHPLFEDELFIAVCDVHPLVKGHVLLIPKEHMSCMGALSKNVFLRFTELYRMIEEFMTSYYGKYAAFEHGVAGQSVFHAHVHFLPFRGSFDDVVPEMGVSRMISSLDEVMKEFLANGSYLFLDIDHEMRLVDTGIVYPRFFRERFAKAMGAEVRADWWTARKDASLMRVFSLDIMDLEKKWRMFCLKR